HYENFRPYHESFYRFVEPTSVTPYTFQARCRALHAALVIAARHSCPDLSANNSAINFTTNAPRIQQIIETLKRRCTKADNRRSAGTREDIDQLVRQWQEIAEECRAQGNMLCYHAPDNDKSNQRLLYNYGDKIKGEWQTLQSMRNVENTALLKTL
ncbi:Superfamily II DNA and RNA helicase, partial [hydrothermal vent metagenome]